MVAPPTGHASLIGSAFGGYEVQALIGRGATGTVYLARDIALGRSVALKVLLGSLARNPSMVRSFYREAQAAAPLRHPGIVRVYSAGIESGTPYIAMEYVAGEPLDRFLRRKGQISWQAALYVGGQVADALQCAHDAGIIHRDIKPANILLDRQGRVRLTDFGIARVRTVEHADGEPTIIGTPQYMSPEQCAGGDVTHATDLYSLGVTLYQMISGKMPFQAESAQALIRRIAQDTPQRLNRMLPDVPDDVARLVAHLMEKDPEKRPSEAQHVSQSIERLQLEEGGRSAIPQALAAFVREQAQDSPVRLMTPPPSKDKARAAKPDVYVPSFNRRLLIAAATAVSTLAILTTGSMWLALRDTETHEPAPAIDSVVFTTDPNGIVLAELNAPAFEAQRLAWAGAGNDLLVEAAGIAGGLQRGATGVLAISPEEQSCLSVAVPQGAQLADGYDAARAVPMALSSGMRNADGGPTILLGQCGNVNASKMTGLVFAQRYDQRTPALNPAAAFETSRSSAALRAMDSGRAIHAVLRPDGGAVCVIVQNADGSQWLAEKRVNAPSAQVQVTTAGLPIVPESLQYVGDGARVLFIRRGPDKKEELWSAPASGAPATLLMVGYFKGEAAANPDATRIAIAWSVGPDQAAELNVIDARDGAVITRHGPGTVGHDAWFSNGTELIVAAPDANGMRQLWLANAANANERRQLTTRPNGVAETTAVSANGEWAAGIAEGESGINVLFVDLKKASTLTTAVSESNSAAKGRA